MTGPRERFWLRTIGPAGTVSLLSLFVAWAAIGFALVGALQASVLCALAAFLLDMLDGFVARKLGVASEFGRQLDSFIDVINYSVYSAVLTGLYLIPGVWGWLIGFVIVATGMLRLIRFNIEGFDFGEAGETPGAIKYYRGVVVCHLSLATIALLIVNALLPDASCLPWLAGVVLLALSFLQLTLIPIRKTGRQALWASLVVPLGIAAVLWLP